MAIKVYHKGQFVGFTEVQDGETRLDAADRVLDAAGISASIEDVMVTNA